MSTSPGAVLLLLLAVFLLLEYFTGRLDWLFALGNQVSTGYKAGASPAPAPATAPPPTGAPSWSTSVGYRRAVA